MSASLCYSCGETSEMTSCLQETLDHAKTFEDSLNAAAMLARLLTSSHKPKDAMTNCLDILTQLGEEFPAQPDPEVLQNKLLELKPIFMSLSVGQMKALPKMRDGSKLQAMKFLGMLCQICVMAAPMLLPLLSVRMLELTLQFGFCNDSIAGICYCALSMVSFRSEFYIRSLCKISLCNNLLKCNLKIVSLHR